MMQEKNLYIIAGCNGAGKTTASYTILPEIIKCKEFVNADEIARGLSPFYPEKAAISSGKIMPERINWLLRENHTFAFETTIATKGFEKLILQAKKKNYSTQILFFWIQNVELAIERVRIRVLEGGHNVEPDVIRRRYSKGIINLFKIYLPIVDGALLLDNSEGKHKLIAQQTINQKLTIFDKDKFNKLKNTI